MRSFTATAVAVALTAAGALVATASTTPAASQAHATPVATHAHAHTRPAWSRTPCEAEDGPGPCYWDAGRRGNHRGHSYWVTADQTAHYLDGQTLRLAVRHGVTVHIG